MRKSALGKGKEKPRARAPEERHTCFIPGAGDPVAVAERRVMVGKTAADEIQERPRPRSSRISQPL